MPTAVRLRLARAIGLAAPMAMNLVSGGSINFTTGSINTSGRNLTLTPGTGSVGMTSAGTDVTVGAGTVSFSSGSDLAIAIHGTVVDTQYEQLNVVGKVNLTGVELAVALNYSPAVGNTFVIVNNDGSDAVIGKFNGLPDGAVFDAANGSFAARLRINYQGGDGNDVVLTAVNVAPTFVVGADQIASHDSGPQTIAFWATSISPGLPSEAGQQLHFVVTENTNPRLFAALPTIDATGNLAFAPAPELNGSAQITIVLSDDGGTANEGADTSPPQTFTITVNGPQVCAVVPNPLERRSQWRRFANRRSAGHQLPQRRFARPSSSATLRFGTPPRC